VPSIRRTLRLAPAALAASAAAPARAAPPSAEDFKVTYYLTDEDGERDRKLTQQDMQQFWNRARCECGQKIRAEITLAKATAIDSVQLQTFVGPNCPDGQLGNTTQYRPCALLDTSFPQTFSTTRSFEFEPVWLAAGVAPGSPQAIDMAIPDATCDSGQGSAGIWMCAENGQQAQCQPEEFFLTDTDNLNVSDGQTKAGIAYDFTAPVAPPTSFSVAAGDGAVEISWDLDAYGDLAGFRVLCALEDGSPVPGKGIDPPAPTDINLGNIYYTADQLCPDGPFGTAGGTGGGTGTGTGTTTGAGTGTGAGTTTGAGTGTGTGTATSTGTGAGTGTGTATGTGTGAGTGTGTGAASGSTTGAASGSTTGAASGSTTGGAGTTTGADLGSLGTLDYAYVCTGHIAATSSSARVEGLENGRTYQFLVVAYDKFGNPVPASGILTAAPAATNDLWDACQDPAYGGICGERGFCHCRAGRPAPAPALLLVAGLGLAARRRRQ